MRADYDERFPNGEKIIHYKYAAYERFSVYKYDDGNYVVKPNEKSTIK